MSWRGRLAPISASCLIAVAVIGCSDSGTQTSGPSRTAPSNAGAADQIPESRAATVGCEGITPRPGWRLQATAVANFGLFVRHLASQARRLSNGNYLVKAGAAVVGDEPVTLRVP